MSSPNLVVGEKITKTYRVDTREINILKEVDIQIQTGAMVSLQGPSGSGKTTLLNILGLIDEPTTGNLYLGEYVLNEKKVKRDVLRRSFIGYVFQQFHLLPQFSAKDNVCLPLAPVKVNFNVEERATKLLERVGLGHRMDHLPSEMSGGEQQRVAIARALINNPKILLCDEPTGNLDPVNRDSILDLLSELNHEGLTVVIATHDAEVSKRCGTSLRLLEGQLFESNGL